LVPRQADLVILLVTNWPVIQSAFIYFPQKVEMQFASFLRHRTADCSRQLNTVTLLIEVSDLTVQLRILHHRSEVQLRLDCLWNSIR